MRKSHIRKTRENLQSSTLPSCRQLLSSSYENHQVSAQNLGEKLFSDAWSGPTDNHQQPETMKVGSKKFDLKFNLNFYHAKSESCENTRCNQEPAPQQDHHRNKEEGKDRAKTSARHKFQVEILKSDHSEFCKNIQNSSLEGIKGPFGIYHEATIN